eukprot:m.133352 g.133352  ORF g.133352 m.133352 type:complete len:252 (-) comp14670_c0_seq11:951-1706(-)
MDFFLSCWHSWCMSMEVIFLHKKMKKVLDSVVGKLRVVNVHEPEVDHVTKNQMIQIDCELTGLSGRKETLWVRYIQASLHELTEKQIHDFESYHLVSLGRSAHVLTVMKGAVTALQITNFSADLVRSHHPEVSKHDDAFMLKLQAHANEKARYIAAMILRRTDAIVQDYSGVSMSLLEAEFHAGFGKDLPFKIHAFGAFLTREYMKEEGEDQTARLQAVEMSDFFEKAQGKPYWHSVLLFVKLHCSLNLSS